MILDLNNAKGADLEANIERTPTVENTQYTNKRLQTERTVDLQRTMLWLFHKRPQMVSSLLIGIRPMIRLIRRTRQTVKSTSSSSYFAAIHGPSSVKGLSILLPSSCFKNASISALLLPHSVSRYVLTYGIGDLLFSPLTEIIIAGWSPVYCLTSIVLWILSFLEAAVDNFGGLLVLRFSLGFFGGPALENGGATVGDIFSPIHFFYGLFLHSLVLPLDQ